MKVLAAFDPSTHPPLTTTSEPFMTLANNGGDAVGCRIITSPYPELGAKCVESFAPAGAAVNCQFRLTHVPPQSDIVGGWRWHRWPIMCDQDTLDAIRTQGQIKWFLSRTGVSNGFVTLGSGWEFTSQTVELMACMDVQTMPFGRGPALQAGVKYWLEVGEHRDPVAHEGTAIVLVNDIEIGRRTHEWLGDDNPDLQRDAAFGLVYTQHSKGPTKVHTGPVTISDTQYSALPPVIVPPPVVIPPPVTPPPVQPPVTPPPTGDPHADMLYDWISAGAVTKKNITVVKNGAVVETHFADGQVWETKRKS